MHWVYNRKPKVNIIYVYSQPRMNKPLGCQLGCEKSRGIILVAYYFITYSYYFRGALKLINQGLFRNYHNMVALMFGIRVWSESSWLGPWTLIRLGLLLTKSFTSCCAASHVNTHPGGFIIPTLQKTSQEHQRTMGNITNTGAEVPHPEKIHGEFTE